MEQASNPSGYESENDGQPDDSYTKWQEAMQGVEFQGGKTVDRTEAETTERDEKWDLKKVSRQLGSNEGGWYEKPNGERFYVKFYKNPSQGRVEFIANAIYARLGIKAVRSEIIQLDGREAIASPAVPDAMPAGKEAQSGSEDVQKGFVADAFLANWDVVGLVYDNIVRGEDGFYRIDNGGSLIFRAQGGDKDYTPDSIPELQSMRIPGRPAGEVFAGITENEISRQALELLSKISPEDIRAIVDESGLEGEARERVLAGLLGRREYLAKVYGNQESVIGNSDAILAKEYETRRSVSEVIRSVMDRYVDDSDGPHGLYPKDEIVCGGEQIDGQKIFVINKGDSNSIEFSFKLRAPTEAIEEITEKMDRGEGEVVLPSGITVKRGKIVYHEAPAPAPAVSMCSPFLAQATPSIHYDTRVFTLCDAYVFEKNGLKIFIADPKSRSQSSISTTCNPSGLVRSAIGLIKIEADASMNPEDIEKALGEVLEKDLGISSALDEISEDAEREYKLARFRWQHKFTGETTPEQIERAERMVKKEVAPGYTTYVEEGRHLEYLSKYGDLRAMHYFCSTDPDIIYKLLKQGLVCMTDRFSRGIYGSGMCHNASEDIDSGGADNVFTRIAPRDAILDHQVKCVIFKPELFDRTDWYSYAGDKFGSTDESVFSGRLSPEEMMEKATHPDNPDKPFDNEQMFRTGIGPSYIETIIVYPESRDEIIKRLKELGLKEFNGRPIEETIVASPHSPFWEAPVHESMLSGSIFDVIFDLENEEPIDIFG